MLVEKIRLEKDERLIKVIRKHWFVLFTKTIGIIFVTIAPVIALFGFYIILRTTPALVDLELPNLSVYITYFGGFWLLLNWMALFHIWTDYYLDVWVLTSKRLVVIDQKGLFHRTIGSFRLEKLQDVNISIKGFLATALNYGTIQAQTAGGSEDEFNTKGLPDPRGIKAMIVHTADELAKEHREDIISQITDSKAL